MDKKDKQIQELLKRAKKCDIKGRMYVYESFKKELQSFEGVDSTEYAQVCRKLANYLRV